MILGFQYAFLLGIVVTAVALAATAATGDLAVLLALRVLAGVGGAVCFVVGGGVAAQAGRTGSGTRATLLLGIYFAGGGVGILISGLIVPGVVDTLGWRSAWLLLAALCLLALLGAVPAARAVPQTEREPAAEDAGGGAGGGPLHRPLAALIAAYTLYGAGYIAYMTFIVADLQSRGASAGTVAVFWSVLGASAAVAAVAWAPLLPALSPRGAVVLVLLIVTVGAGLPVLVHGTVATLASAILFGASFLAVITAVTGAARRALPPRRWTAAIALLTTAFALGQCAGPVLSGAVSAGPGGIRLGLGLGTALLLLAAGVALLHRRTAAPSP